MEWEAAGKSGDKPVSKGRRAKHRTLIIALVVVALLVVGGIARCGSSTPKDLNWPESGLATMLPKPDSAKGEVSTNSDDTLYVRVNGYDETKYAKYVDACKDKGFTVDAKNETKSYEAYSEDGYHLSLSCYSNELSIRLEAPVAMDSYTWPTSGPATLVPKPASDKGKIDSNSSTHFSILVGDTTAEGYSAYVDECLKAGFDVDFHRSDETFWANNADGAKVNIDFKGNKQMKITIQAATESAGSSSSGSAADNSTVNTETSAASTDAAPAADTPAAADGVSPDLKATMDSYEEFMNKYVDFMQKYKDGGSSMSMAADYAKMVAQYSDMTKKIDALDDSTMSDADLAYYLEVMNRVNEKLATVA